MTITVAHLSELLKIELENLSFMFVLIKSTK